ncbi:MAG: MoaD/ThiS family protein [Dehalococcoidales bacterium]|nr:MoaD/ThiS family protein [Dehalococcoidales bacterium]
MLVRFHGSAGREKLHAGIIERRDRLEENYKFNINGNFYYAGMDFQLHPGDRIALLVPVTGG